MSIDFIKSVYYEILSYFVPVRQKYKIEGKCLQCGKCCREIRAYGLKNNNELRLMKLFLPWYHRFFITGKDTDGNLVLSCKYLNPNGKCNVYSLRPLVCRNYPKKYIHFRGEMPDGCGYKVLKKDFKDYL